MADDSMERELSELPQRAVELGAVERIEDALAAEAVLGPVVAETKPGLLSRRVPVWGMLAACLVMASSAGVLGWVIKPAETVDFPQINILRHSEIKEQAAEPVIEVVRLDRPLFERRTERAGIDPSRWTMGH
jgi:hypothetical protein